MVRQIDPIGPDELRRCVAQHVRAANSRPSSDYLTGQLDRCMALAMTLGEQDLAVQLLICSAMRGQNISKRATGALLSLAAECHIEIEGADHGPNTAL